MTTAFCFYDYCSEKYIGRHEHRSTGGQITQHAGGWCDRGPHADPLPNDGSRVIGPAEQLYRADELRRLGDEIQQLRSAVTLALEQLRSPHKHDWRPDLVRCAFEQDAESILLGALASGEERLVREEAVGQT